MRQRKAGQIINISSISVQTEISRFSAYAGSKAALDACSASIAVECAPDNVVFTTIFMPLVKTGMLSGNDYDHLDVLTPEQASQLIERAMVTKERRIETSMGWWARLGHLLAPSFTQSILTLQYQMEPEAPPKGKAVSASAQGDKSQLQGVRRLFAGAF